MHDFGIHVQPAYMQPFLSFLLVFRVLAYNYFNCVLASGTKSRRQSMRTVRLTTCTTTLFQNDSYSNQGLKVIYRAQIDYKRSVVGLKIP